jgi:hypothetical protein
VLDGGNHRGKRLVPVREHDIGIVCGETVAEKICEILRKAPVVSGEWTPDAQRLLILGDQQTSRDNDQDYQDARKDPVMA